MSVEEIKRMVFAIETSADLWQGLAYYLAANGFEVLLVSPLTTYHSRALPNHDYSRTDPKDAWLIGDSARRGYYDRFKILPSNLQAMKTLSLTYDKLRKDMARHRNRLRSLIHRYFPEFLKVLNLDTDTAFYLLSRYYLPHHFLNMDIIREGHTIRKISRNQHGVETLMKLRRLAENSIGITRVQEEELADRLTINSWLALIKSTKTQMQSVITELITLAKEISAFNNIKSIKGISEIIAGLFLAETNGLQDFTHYKQIQKRAGLNLRLKQSGRYNGYHRISGIGNARLRWLIFMMEKETAKYVPEVRIKFLKRQLKRSNYVKNLIATTPQLLQLIMALVKDNRSYEYREETLALMFSLNKAYEQKKKNKKSVL